jgi:hypothetical protein
MKLCLKILAVAAITASTYSLTSCSAPSGFSYQNVSVSISSFCSDCAQGGILVFYNPAYPQPPNPGSVVEMTPGGGQGGTNTFVANVTNAPATNVTWTLYPQPNLNSIDQLPTGTSLPVGESSNPSGTIVAASGNTVYYNTPGVPIYTGAALQQANAMGIPQGDVLLVASVPSDPSDPTKVATASQLIQVYNASPGSPVPYLVPKTSTSPANQTQPAVTVPRNTSFAFYGGVAGAYPCTSPTACAALVPAGQTPPPTYTTDNTVVWAVGPAPFALGTAIPGGNATYGTITPQGVYTAPATIPTTTNSSTTINGEVVVYVISHFVSTVNNYAYVGVN